MANLAVLTGETNISGQPETGMENSPNKNIAVRTTDRLAAKPRRTAMLKNGRRVSEIVAWRDNPKEEKSRHATPLDDEFARLAMQELGSENSYNLSGLEQTIKNATSNGLKGALALFLLHKNLLYKETHNSFEAYCQKSLGTTRYAGFRRIKFAGLHLVLLHLCNSGQAPNGLHTHLKNEALALALLRLPSVEERVAALQSAVEAASGKPLKVKQLYRSIYAVCPGLKRTSPSVAERLRRTLAVVGAVRNTLSDIVQELPAGSSRLAQLQSAIRMLDEQLKKAPKVGAETQF